MTVMLISQYVVLCMGYNELIPTTFEALATTFAPRMMILCELDTFVCVNTAEDG